MKSLSRRPFSTLIALFSGSRGFGKFEISCSERYMLERDVLFGGGSILSSVQTCCMGRHCSLVHSPFVRFKICCLSLKSPQFTLEEQTERTKTANVEGGKSYTHFVPGARFLNFSSF